MYIHEYTNFVFCYSQDYRRRTVQFSATRLRCDFTLTACPTAHGDRCKGVACKKRKAILFSDGHSRKTSEDICISHEIKRDPWLTFVSAHLFLFSQCHFSIGYGRFPFPPITLFRTHIVSLSINTIFVMYPLRIVWRLSNFLRFYHIVFLFPFK